MKEETRLVNDLANKLKSTIIAIEYDKMRMAEDNWMTPEECATWLRMGLSTLRKDTEIPKFRVGNSWRYSKIDIINFIKTDVPK